MLLHCPTCRSPIDAGLLPPGSMATCPHCHGLFQVPPSVTHTPAIEPSPQIELAVPQQPEEPPGGMGGTIAWTLLFLCLIAVIGGGSGYLAYRFVQAQERPHAGQPPTVVEEPVEEPDPNARWRTLGHWSGTGQISTPPFRTTAPRWRIRWNATPLDNDNPDNFAITVSDISGKQLKTPVSIVGAGDATAYVTTKPARHVLEILTFNTRWEVSVEEPE